MESTRRPRTAFQRYLESVGDEKAAEILQAKRRTVQSWRLGDRRPRPEEARQIIARLPVTFDDIYGTTGEERGRVLEEAGALLRDATQQQAGGGQRRQMG